MTPPDQLPLSITTKLQLNKLAQDQCLHFTIEQYQLFAINYQGQLYIYWNRCPHHNKQLMAQKRSCFDDSLTLIECQHHAAQFHPSKAHCVSGPCMNKHLTSFKVKTSGDTYILKQVHK